MKKVAIIGAGLMTKPLVDYFIEKCGYQVIMVDRIVSKAEKVIAGRLMGKAVLLPNTDPDILDEVISEVDIVISMVPKPIHIHVAESCLRNRKSMLTVAYEAPELLASPGAEELFFGARRSISGKSTSDGETHARHARPNCPASTAAASEN